MSKFFVTGGAGFIGSNFIKSLLNDDHFVINFDLLTYAASKDTVKDFIKERNFKFVKGNILDKKRINQIYKIYEPDAIINFAAETHVDRSIDDPDNFITTNILGTFQLLNTSYKYWKCIKNIKKKNKFRFLQISTDEVYGSIKKGSASEKTLLSPNSPYSASKASADNFVRAYNHTYGLNTIITRCSNNYGKYQYPEKLIPLMIKNRTGCIIGISSVVAITGNPGQANYTASKSAMIAMYKSLALEVAQRNIRLNVIAPGFIKTPMTEKLNDGQVKEMLNKIPMNRFGTPNDVANLAVFLSSDE